MPRRITALVCATLAAMIVYVSNRVFDYHDQSDWLGMSPWVWMLAIYLPGMAFIPIGLQEFREREDAKRKREKEEKRRREEKKREKREPKERKETRRISNDMELD